MIKTKQPDPLRTLSERFWGGGQVTNYERVAVWIANQGPERHMLRISISVDKSNDTCPTVARWNGEQWHPVLSRTPNELGLRVHHNMATLPGQSEYAAAAATMLADALMIVLSRLP